MIRALAICALAAGALGCDPCSGAPGACVALTVDGPAGASIDRLEVTIRDPVSDHHGSQTGARHTLPLHTLLEVADGIVGNLIVEVQGFDGADAIGSGITQVTLGPGGHTAAEVQLGPPITTVDAGAIPDLASNVDLGNADLAVLPDLVHCPTGAIYCDNCENGINLPWLGTISDGGTIGTEVASAHSPITGFQFTAPGNIPTDEAYITAAFPDHATGMVAARIFLDPIMAIPDRTTILQFGDKVRIYPEAGNWTIDWPGGSRQTNLQAPLLQTFVCVEVDVDLDQKMISLYTANNAPEVGMPMMLDPIGSLSLGLIDLPMGTSALIYVDDIVIDTKHIGCN